MVAEVKKGGRMMPGNLILFLVFSVGSVWGFREGYSFGKNRAAKLFAKTCRTCEKSGVNNID